MHPTDFTLDHEGTSITFQAENDAAQQCAVDTLGLADWQWMSPRRFAVAQRVAGALVAQLRADGWVIR